MIEFDIVDLGSTVWWSYPSGQRKGAKSLMHSLQNCKSFAGSNPAATTGSTETLDMPREVYGNSQVVVGIYYRS